MRLVVCQKREVPFLSGSWHDPAAAITRRMTRGGQTDGQEIDTAGDQASGRGPRTPRTDHAQPAGPPEARLAGPHRPGTGFGLRAGRDHSADGRVEADGPAPAGKPPACRTGAGIPERHAPGLRTVRRLRRPLRMVRSGHQGPLPLMPGLSPGGTVPGRQRTVAGVLVQWEPVLARAGL